MLFRRNWRLPTTWLAQWDSRQESYMLFMLYYCRSLTQTMKASDFFCHSWMNCQSPRMWLPLWLRSLLWFWLFRCSIRGKGQWYVIGIIININGMSLSSKYPETPSASLLSQRTSSCSSLTELASRRSNRRIRWQYVFRCTVDAVQLWPKLYVLFPCLPACPC